jgi:hypothetical protein
MREAALVWKILVVGGVILSIVVGGLLALFEMTAPVADAATHFVVTAGSAGPAAAYAEAAPGLRRAMPETVFEARLRRLGLTQARSASWSNRSLNGGDATVSGTVKLASGDSTPLTVRLAKSNGVWQVTDLAYGIPTPVDN